MCFNEADRFTRDGPITRQKGSANEVFHTEGRIHPDRNDLQGVKSPRQLFSGAKKRLCSSSDFRRKGSQQIFELLTASEFPLLKATRHLEIQTREVRGCGRASIPLTLPIVDGQRSGSQCSFKHYAPCSCGEECSRGLRVAIPPTWLDQLLQPRSRVAALSARTT